MKEHEIRPQDLLKKYLQLCAQDAERCFTDVDRRDLPCVACGNEQSTFQFEKNGFAYACCDVCATLYQTPRPAIEIFEDFYRNSESSRYWADVFFPSVAEIRRDKIFRPRVERLARLCEQRGLSVQRLIDIGAGYGIFLDEWKKRFPEVEAVAVEPSVSLAQECRAKGFQVKESIAENVTGLDGFADLAVCFEVLEHVDDPLAFVKVLKNMVRPGGYVFVSTLCIDGFDLQTLWEKSTQISPPHHINFLSVRGFESLFERGGLEEVDVITPGVLDVDIVRNALKTDSTLLAGNRFLSSLLSHDKGAKAFQSFLSENQLSSHAWVLSRKPLQKDNNE